MRFENPLYLLYLFMPVLFICVWKFLNGRKKKMIEESFSTENINDFNLWNKDQISKNWKFRILCLLSFVCLVFGLARPQFGLKQKSALVSESSVVFLVDLSRSMLTRDLSPSRLEVLKEEIDQTLSSLAEVRVGLVAFAGSVNVISPMTSDLEAVSSYVKSLSTDSVSSQGTRIEVGLKEAKGLFERSAKGGALKDQTKTIVLFSDGEDHQAESLSYVKKMTGLGYQIFTVGVGTESGGFIPEGEFSSTYIKDLSGQMVVSKPNFNFLKTLAKTGGGAFFYLSPADPLGPKLKRVLDSIEGVAASKRQFVVRNELYQIFLVLSCLLVLLGVLVRKL